MSGEKPIAYVLRPCRVVVDGIECVAQRIRIDKRTMLLPPDKSADYARRMVARINCGDVSVEIRELSS